MGKTKMTFRAMKTVLRSLYGEELARIIVSARTPVGIICAEPDKVHIQQLFNCMRRDNEQDNNYSNNAIISRSCRLWLILTTTRRRTKKNRSNGWQVA